jgi:hypothetical protein
VSRKAAPLGTARIAREPVALRLWVKRSRRMTQTRPGGRRPRTRSPLLSTMCCRSSPPADQRCVDRSVVEVVTRGLGPRSRCAGWLPCPCSSP